PGACGVGHGTRSRRRWTSRLDVRRWLRAQARPEEREHPRPGILGGYLVVAAAHRGHPLDPGEPGTVSREEPVAGAGIRLDVVLDAQAGQPLLQPGGAAPEREVPPAIARHGGTEVTEDRVVPGHR